MKVLHISHDFYGSKVHGNLYKALDKEGINQVVYTYFDDEKYNGRNKFEAPHTDIVYSKALNKYDKFFYHYKIYKLYKDIKRKVSVDSVDLIHATTLFSDGGAAYKLFRKYKIPYIVSVRNTDINIYLKKMPHTWPLCKQILLNAGKIVFISEAHRRQFITHKYINKFQTQIKDKIVVLPNGIEDFWLNNIVRDRIIEDDNHNLLYVGVYDENKNVLALMDAVSSLKSKYPNIKLTLVGGKGDLKVIVKEKADGSDGMVEFKGLVTDKQVLLDIYRQNSVYAMPSHTETFGLVYVEAMTQGLACIYTKGQGIDGMFNEKVGIGVNSHSTEDIAKAIDIIFSNRSNYSTEGVEFEQFRWDKISMRYISFYKEIINNKK